MFEVKHGGLGFALHLYNAEGGAVYCTAGKKFFEKAGALRLACAGGPPHAGSRRLCGRPQGFHAREVRKLYYVYMLRCWDGSLYTGSTDCVERRLAAHSQGRGAKYTRSRLPVELVYQESCPDKSAALRREAAIKRLSRREKLKLLAGQDSGA